MALPVTNPLYNRNYGSTITTSAATASAFAAVVGRGQLVGARVSQGAATTIDATLSLLVNGVTVTGSTITQTASGSVTGSVTSIICSPTSVQDGDWLECRRGAGVGTAVGSQGVTFIVSERTL